MTTLPLTGQVAVLRDYPLRLWAHQQEYTQGVLREFELLLAGESSGLLRHSAPGQLVDMAQMFTSRFGPLIDALNAERQGALNRGLDRIDSRVPLVEGTPTLLEQVERVLDGVDDFCRDGSLLTLPREPVMVRFAAWVREELVRQYEGGEPTPWPGPFHLR